MYLTSALTLPSFIRGFHKSELIGKLSVFYLAGLFAFMWFVRYRDYISLGDDVAVLSATVEGGIVAWFKEGFAHYFDSYPEWFSRGNDFMRPTGNAIIYLHHLLFSTNYPIYFLYFFAFQYLSVSIFILILKEMGVRGTGLLVLGALMLVNPSFINDGLLMVACQFDVIAALLTLAAFYFVASDKYAAALVALTLAVFTKESALFAPLAAACSILVRGRNPLWALAMLGVLGLWTVLRLGAFGDVSGGTYAVPDSSVGYAINALKGFLIWPTGIVPGRFVKEFLTGQLDFSLWNVVWGLITVVNIALWIAIAAISWQAARRFAQRPLAPGRQLDIILLIWTIGALSFGVLLGPISRYGAIIYPFVLLMVGRFFFTRQRQPKTTAGLVAAVGALTALISVIDYTNLSGDRQISVNLQKALYKALRQLPQDGRQVYIVNAPSQFFSAPKFFRRAWKLDVDVSYISQFEGCVSIDPAPRTAESSFQGRTLHVRVPDCAIFYFQGASRPMLAQAVSGKLARPSIGSYFFPDGNVLGKRTLSTKSDQLLIDFGRELIVELSDPTTTILSYNWGSQSYEILAP